MSELKATAWVLTNCPYSFKFRLFVTEAGLAGRFEFLELDPDSDGFAQKKSELDKRSGQKTALPTVEIAPGEFMSDSDALIEHFSGAFGVDHKALPTLSFYRSGLYVCYLEMYSILARPLGWIARLGRRPKAFR